MNGGKPLEKSVQLEKLAVLEPLIANYISDYPLRFTMLARARNKLDFAQLGDRDFFFFFFAHRYKKRYTNI